jgi:hypothetical protein
LDTGTMAQRDALAAGDGDESYEPIHLQKRGTTNNDREKGGRGLERIGFVVRPEATASSFLLLQVLVLAVSPQHRRF